ncbi:MAG: 50S ribosomal protein L22 [bacterium]
MAAAQAKLKVVRISPRKVQKVASLIRRKKALEAVSILEFTPNKAAGILNKLLKSAIANAENNHDLTKEDLVVSRVDIGRGFYFRRFQARARGRGSLVRSATAVLRIVLEEKEAGRGSKG